MKRRVVVTGMGAITPIGLNVEDFWQSIKEGRHGFAPITRFDTSEYKCHIAAEVKGFEGKNFMDFKAAKRMELFSQYAVAAAKEALLDSGIHMEEEDLFHFSYQRYLENQIRGTFGLTGTPVRITIRQKGDKEDL